MSDKKVQPLNLEEGVIELLKVQAEDNDRSMSAEANRILKKALQKT
ncbi:MAG TPA: Arc family DNA-binding protein [Flavobacteriales bacterium]|nr:Arc family DNA-binding protein [Flavobacteriales bacterium]